jgi:hypothetical protein
MIVAKSTFRWSDDTAEAGDATLVAYCYRLALSANASCPGVARQTILRLSILRWKTT